MREPNYNNTYLDFFIELCRKRIDKIFNNCDKYGYVQNFLYQGAICEADREALGWQNSMFHRELFQHVLRAEFGTHKLDKDNKSLLEMDDNAKKELLKTLAKKAVPLFTDDDKKKNLTQNKIVSPTGYLMEMMTSSQYWTVTENEITRRDLFNKIFKLDSEMRKSAGHVADDIILIKGDVTVRFKDLYKMLVRDKLLQDFLPKNFRGQGNHLVLGSNLFGYPMNKGEDEQLSGLRENNGGLLSDRLLELAANIHAKMKGHQVYSTGISLTAMRYLCLLGFTDRSKEEFYKEKLEIAKILLSHIAKTDFGDFYDIECDEDNKIILKSKNKPKYIDVVTGKNSIDEFSHHSHFEVLIAMNIFQGIFIDRDTQNNLNQEDMAKIIEESVSRAYKSLGIEEQLNKELERMR